MKRKRIWFSLAGLTLVALAIGTYLTVWRTNRSVESLMPADALLVFESAALQDSVSTKAMRTEMPLRQAPIFQEAVQRLERFMYSPVGAEQLDSGRVRQFLTNRPIRYSLHPVSKTALEFIFYIPVQSLTDGGFLDQFQHPDPRQLHVQSHLFGGQRVFELSTLTNELLGSFLLINDHLVGSPSGVLIENVIRRYRQPLTATKKISFKNDNEHLASLFIRPEVLQNLFSTAESRQAEATGSLVRLFLPEAMTLQFRRSVARTHLVGYASDAIGSRRDVADLFAGQTPVRIASADLIPQTTATLYHLGLSDASRFGQAMTTLLATADNPALTARIQRLRPATNDLYSALEQDILLCRLESPDQTPRQILILKASDVKKASEAYQRAAFLAGPASASKPAMRLFLKHKTLLLDVPELPASLFSSLFSGFRQSWLTQHGSYLIITNSETVMQDYLQQLERNTVWSADERQVQLLKQILRPANFTAFVRVNRAQAALPGHWPLPWRNLLNHPNPSMANLENMVYQASYGNQKILSTLVLGRTSRRASQAVLNRLLLQKKIEFNASLISAPAIAGNLADGSAQIWAQNSANQFVMLTRDGDKVVQDTTDGPVRSNVVATDYLDNGRLQYLFMTNRSLYVADLLEKSVKLRSVRLPAGIDPTYLSLPQGSRQRSLVVLAAHKEGSIYAFDKNRKSFIRLFSSGQSRQPLLLPFQVIPTATGLSVLALQPKGTLNYWLESGGNPAQQAPHFPAKLDLADSATRFVSPALLPGSADGRQSGHIRLITQAGELLELNEKGLIASRTQLYRPIRSGSFRLFPDVNQTNWLLLRTTDTEAAILDQQGQNLLDIRGLKSGESDIRYYRLGAGVDVISVKSGAFTTLYDLRGQVIGDRPIPSDFPVSLQFDEFTNQLYIVSGRQKAVQIFTIRLR